MFKFVVSITRCLQMNSITPWKLSCRIGLLPTRITTDTNNCQPTKETLNGDSTRSWPIGGDLLSQPVYEKACLTGPSIETRSKFQKIQPIHWSQTGLEYTFKKKKKNFEKFRDDAQDTSLASEGFHWRSSINSRWYLRYV